MTGSFQTRVIQGWSRSVPLGQLEALLLHGGDRTRDHLRLRPVTSTALLTDHYELTMLQAALRSGAAAATLRVRGLRPPPPRGPPVRRRGRHRPPARGHPGLPLRRGGADRAARAPTWSTSRRWTSSPDYRFTGDISGYAEGECFFPGSPLVVVEACFAEGVLLETLVLSILNHDAAVAAAASRMVCAAGDRPCLEMGSRRTHEQAAVAAARAAYVAGFAATSNLEAGRRYGVPDRRHQRARVHPAARRRADGVRGAGGRPWARTRPCWSTPTTWPRPCETAVEVAGPELGAVRLDSGDLLTQAAEVRAQLDALGARDTRIIVTSDLDEYAIAALAAAPVDAYGVGTSLVTGSGAPTAGLVYKLVVPRRRQRRAGRTWPRRARTRPRVGGRKWALRRATRRRRGRGRGDRHRRAPGRRRRRPPAAGASSCAAARWSATDLDLASARRRHERSRRRAAAQGPPALPRRAGHPDRLRDRPS